MSCTFFSRVRIRDRFLGTNVRLEARVRVMVRVRVCGCVKIEIRVCGYAYNKPHIMKIEKQIRYRVFLS